LPQAQAMTAAKVNALRALQLDESQSRAHLALARVFWCHELDLAQAKAHFERAIELAPNDGGAYGDYTIALSFFGPFNEADQALPRGDEFDPQSYNLLGGWCWRHYLGRNFEKTRQAANQFQTAHPRSVMGTRPPSCP
jgi:Tfp pilus assembly protein PilF